MHADCAYSKFKCRSCRGVWAVCALCWASSCNWRKLDISRTSCALLVCVFCNCVFEGFKMFLDNFVDEIRWRITKTRVRILRSNKWNAKKQEQVYQVLLHVRFTDNHNCSTKILKFRTNYIIINIWGSIYLVKYSQLNIFNRHSTTIIIKKTKTIFRVYLWAEQRNACLIAQLIWKLLKMINFDESWAKKQWICCSAQSTSSSVGCCS